MTVSNSQQLLQDIQIASPCQASWSEMIGDKTSRHCNLCEKFVYNISEMTAQQAQDLIFTKEGQSVCVKLFKRADGTVMTADCPTAKASNRSVYFKVICMFIFSVFAILGGTALAFGDSKYYQRVEDTICKFLGIQQEEELVQMMGEVCIPTPSPSATKGN